MAIMNPLQVMRRSLLLIVIGALLASILGVFYKRTLPPTYTATAVLLVDTRQVRALQDAYVFNGEADLASQIELLKSDAIASRIVDQLGLAVARHDDPSSPVPWSFLTHFLAQGPSIAGEVAVKANNDELRRKAIEDFKLGLAIERIPKTLVLNISYTSSNPQTAANIADAVAEAYIEDQRLAHKDAARRATDWLNEQLGELKVLVHEADEAIQQFKASRGLITTEGGLLQERRLTEANRQLMLAREEVERFSVRHTQVAELLSAQDGFGFTTELITDPLFAQLRTRYLTVVADERTSASKLGEGHYMVQRLRKQKSELERLMRTELQRIATTLNNELEIARAREAKLSKDFEQQSALNTQSDEVQIELRELERRSDAYKKVYNDLLQRHQNALQQQSLDERQARIITHAQLPQQKNGPSTLRILAFAMLMGAAAGGGLGFIRDLSDRTFRTAEQVRSELMIEPIWMLPRVTRRISSWTQGKAAAMDAAAASESAGELQTISTKIPALFNHAFVDSGSTFSRTIQAIKLHLDQTHPEKTCKRIGIISVLANEGTLTVAKNLASIAAGTGARTLLVDGDMDKRELTNTLAPTAEKGIAEAADRAQAPELDAILFQEKASGLRFLPAVGRHGSPRFTADFLAGTAMQSLLQRVSQDFEYVVVNLPPIAKSLDARAIAPQLDAVILVVAWGQTPRAVVEQTLSDEPELDRKCVGVVLNEVNLRRLMQYEPADPRWS